MKTYRELINEAYHVLDRYIEWGLMNRRGQLIRGDRKKDEEIDNHGKLLGARDTTNNFKHYPDYAQDVEGNSLLIRTYSPEGLKTAIDNWHKFPHMESGTVRHEHFSEHPLTSGHNNPMTLLHSTIGPHNVVRNKAMRAARGECSIDTNDHSHEWGMD